MVWLLPLWFKNTQINMMMMAINNLWEGGGGIETLIRSFEKKN